MRRGTHFPYRVDPAHWVNPRGIPYTPALKGVNDVHIGTRPQRSSRLVGVAFNNVPLQQFNDVGQVNHPGRVRGDGAPPSAENPWSRRNA